jgi:hypothetical protein
VFLSQGQPVALTSGYGDETPMFANRYYYSDNAIGSPGRSLPTRRSTASSCGSTRSSTRSHGTRPGCR